jgi:c-di-GMP-binding flagellar brake protein YcgR
MGKFIDKRQHPRLHVYHLAKYRLTSNPNSPLVTAHIKDIGGGGACLCLEESLPVSTIIQLYINFPLLPQPVKSLAKVAWTRKIGKSNSYESGLQFIEIEEAYRRQIISRIESVKKEADDTDKKRGL